MRQNYQLHASLGYQLTLLSRINERRFEENLAPLGLTRVKWCVLLAVHEEGLKNPSEISNFVGIDRTATSRALRLLDRSGLITRCDGTGDKRTREVALTEKGIGILDQAITAATDNASHFGTKLSQKERQNLSQIIDKLMAGEPRGVTGL